ncbi:cation:proton antiporter [Methanocella arvoryzae]|uniref:Na(+)/H(+) antiporter n=1 Tax=Methanocella arvoryzae (strain DSM 22066 / NBRC 105507 / MRE50) TaxID=351160 RepID=Q0W7H4_METAR|nr:cation:proton antiporter [Methanocella arvoryzae]CAJ35669.1 putative Na(+)/H(+) antiporter [Methanocella arvoryzae MRE50]
MLDTDLLLLILLALAGGKILGMISERLGFPSIIGELTVGIVMVLLLPGMVHEYETDLEFMANLGVMFMMFIMGLSINIETVMKANARSATAITLIGASLVFVTAAFFTLVTGLAMGQEFYYSLAQACIIGIALTSTSTVIGFRYLTAIGDRFSNVFKTLVAVEVTDGIFSIVLLAVFLSVIGVYTTMVAGGGADLGKLLSEIGWSSFKLLLLILGFMILVIKFGGKVANWMLGITRKEGENDTIITLSLVLLFGVAWLSEWLQLTPVIGAFLAGAILAGSPFSETVIAPKIKAVGYGLFIPIFFAFIGMKMDFGAIFGGASLNVLGIGIPYYFLLFLLLLGGVLVSKYAGAIIGCAYAGGFKPFEAGKIGSSAVCVGEDTLVIAQIGSTVLFAAGTAEGQPLVTSQLFSVLGLLIIATSIITPFLLNVTFSKSRSQTPPIRSRHRHRTRGGGL